MHGIYFFGDYESSRLFSLRYDGSTPFNGTNFVQRKDWVGDITTDIGTIARISSFAEDAVGNLYVIDRIGGELFKLTDAVMPVVTPTSMTVESGTLQSGDVTSTFTSDDVDVVVERADVFPPRIHVVFDGTLSSDSPSELLVQFESRVTAFFFNRVNERIEMYNWSTDSFEQVNGRKASQTDRITVVNLTADIAKYVQPGTGNVRTKLIWLARAQPSFNWDAEIDQLVWIEE